MTSLIHHDGIHDKSENVYSPGGMWTLFLLPKTRHVFLLAEKACLIVQQGHVLLFNKNMCLLALQEDMSSCSTRRHVSLFNKTAFCVVLMLTEKVKLKV